MLYIYIYTHTHSYMYVYVCVCVCRQIFSTLNHHIHRYKRFGFMAEGVFIRASYYGVRGTTLRLSHIDRAFMVFLKYYLLCQLFD
jgi:hypothetical protein